MIATQEVQFTKDQIDAQEAIIQFVKSGKMLFTMGGYAGTGKTTVIANAISKVKELKQFENLSIAFCCFTGKASTVLREKLQTANALSDKDYCGTIHGLIYRPDVDDNGRIKWIRMSRIEYGLIVIDEASMVGDSIFEDLQKYGVPIIAVGDHGQLPPVFSKFNLMENPMIRLEKIHRQAEGNPIIHLSMLARHGERIEFGDYTSVHSDLKMQIVKIKKDPVDAVNSIRGIDKCLVLCGINRTRVMLNRVIRNRVLNNVMRGRIGDIDPVPRVGEQVICLKNNRREGIFNGMVGVLLEAHSAPMEDWIRVKIRFDLMGLVWSGAIFKHQFGRERTLRGWKDWQRKIEYDEMTIGNLFDFGYCITVHKSQGSQAENVVLIEERMRGMSQDNFNRWLYTGITRASKNLAIVASK